MITGIEYNCDPNSLGDISREAFVDAFEAAVAASPRFRNVTVRVTFLASRSEVTKFTSDDWESDISHEEEFREAFSRIAEKAFAATCE
jgi:hypothetical protein